MESINFKQSTADPCIIASSKRANFAIIAVYLDDLIIITQTPETMKKIKDNLAMRFKMKNLGKLHYCLEISIEYDKDKGHLWMHQRQ